MAAAEIREFSLAHEIEKLKDMLNLPVTNVVFDDRYEYGKLYIDEDKNLTVIYGQLYVNDEWIGTIPYMSDRWGPMYDTSKQKELAWDKVYRQYEQQILSKIHQQQPQAATAEVKDYRSLYIKDSKGKVINWALCSYIDNNWQVILHDPDYVEKVIVKQISIQAPPPPASDTRHQQL